MRRRRSGRGRRRRARRIAGDAAVAGRGRGRGAAHGAGRRPAIAAVGGIGQAVGAHEEAVGGGVHLVGVGLDRDRAPWVDALADRHGHHGDGAEPTELLGTAHVGAVDQRAAIAAALDRVGGDPVVDRRVVDDAPVGVDGPLAPLGRGRGRAHERERRRVGVDHDAGGAVDQAGVDDRAVDGDLAGGLRVGGIGGVDLDQLGVRGARRRHGLDAVLGRPLAHDRRLGGVARARALAEHQQLVAREQELLVGRNAERQLAGLGGDAALDGEHVERAVLDRVEPLAVGLGRVRFVDALLLHVGARVGRGGRLAGSGRGRGP